MITIKNSKDEIITIPLTSIFKIVSIGTQHTIFLTDGSAESFVMPEVDFNSKFNR